MRTRKIAWIRMAGLFLFAATGATAQCLDDGAALLSGQLDFDALFAALDDSLLTAFPAWQTRFNQENPADPSPRFAHEDNTQNGLDDDDHLDLIAAIMDGEPTDHALQGLDPADVADIRTSFAANRAKIRADLTFKVLYLVTVSILDEIEKGDPEFSARLQDMVAAYMTIGDAESLSFIRGFLITLSEIFIEEGVASGAIPALVEGATKSAMRTAVNNNFTAARYACFGDAPAATKPNLLGDSGNANRSGDNNETAYSRNGRNRQAWLTDKGIALPPLQLTTPSANLSASAGEEVSLQIAVAGGDGSIVEYDWKRYDVSIPWFSRVAAEPDLRFDYVLPQDAGVYVAVLCDDTWIRRATAISLSVNPQPFRIAQEPADASGQYGDDLSFSVRVVGGLARPGYQWKKGNTPDSLNPIPNATSQVLVVNNLQPADAGYYQVEITGKEQNTVVLVSRTARLTVADAPPQITLLGADPLALECGNPLQDPGATALDDLDGDLTSKIIAAGTVDSNTPGQYIRTYSVTDSGGKTASITRRVRVQDTTPPNITLWGPDALLVECGDEYNEAGATAQDDCDGEWLHEIIPLGQVDTHTPGRYLLQYSVTDSAGNTAQTTRQVTVQDSLAPALSLVGNPSITLECGGVWLDPGASATDACNGNLSENIVLRGEVNTQDPGEYQLSYQVADDAGNAAQKERTVLVKDSTPPDITLLGNPRMTVECASPFVDPGASAADACDGNLTEDILTLGTVNIQDPGEYRLTYRVADNAGNAAQKERTVLVKDSTPPDITLIGAPILTLECGSPFADPGAAASDACQGDLSNRITRTGTLRTDLPGDYTLVYHIADAAGNTAQISRIVTVSDTAKPELRLNGSAEITLECGSRFSDPGATAIDTCDGSLDGAMQRIGSVDTASPGTYTVQYRVQDTAGLTADLSRQVTVVDTTPPAFITQPPESLELECGDTAPIANLAAVDVCSGDVTDSITIENTVLNAVPGTYALTYSATDAAGNAAQVRTTVTVIDTTPPALTLLGAPQIQLECGDAFQDPGATASDACAGDLTDQIVPSGTLDSTLPGEYNLAYRVADPTGNFAQASRTVSVTDTVPPEIELRGEALMTIDCGDAFQDPGVTAFDACDGDLTGRVQISGEVTGDTPGLYQLEYHVTDQAGNIGHETRTVEIRHNCALTISQQPRGAAIYVGTPYTFRVVAEGGTAPLQYTWQQNGAIIASGPNPTWAIPSARLADAGSYLCEVTDGLTTARSFPAVLAVFETADAGHHSADTTKNWAISLTELLRVIQFFNRNGYQCQPGSEDGYGVGTGFSDCAQHDSDYAPNDWDINLTELLRLIQFFNMPNHAYHPAPATEDGFAPGAGNAIQQP